MLTIAAAQALPWACAAEADFEMPPDIAASPMTWMLGMSFEAKLTGSIGHQPVLSAAPAISAMRPAFCGGITLATCAVCLLKSVISVLVDGSTDVTLPPCDSATHSTMPGYNSFQAFWNSRCWGN